MASSRPADPLHLTDLLLVDGNNLLHALSSSRTPAPRSALIGRLRGAIPGSIAIEVVFDGPSSAGLSGARVASGLRVRYGGRRSADAVLLSMVEDTRTADGPAATAAILVVTDDADLRRRLHGKGARSAGTAWLLGRIGRGERPAATPPTTPAVEQGGDGDGEDDAARWEPGRRATVKKGNPRRRRRRAPHGPR